MYNLEQHKSIVLKTKPEIENWLKEYKIPVIEIIETPDNEVFPFLVKARHLRIEGKNMPYLPVGFSEVLNSVDILHCKLESLRGVPKIVGGMFSVENNNLTSLEFSPIEVAGPLFDFCRNNITSLDFFPENFEYEVKGHKNKITKLKLPREHYLDINLMLNDITDVSEAPLSVKMSLNLQFNPLSEDVLTQLRTQNGAIFLLNEDKNIKGIEFLSPDLSGMGGCYVSFKDLPAIKEKLKLEKELKSSNNISSPVLKI